MSNFRFFRFWLKNLSFFLLLAAWSSVLTSLMSSLMELLVLSNSFSCEWSESRKYGESCKQSVNSKGSRPILVWIFLTLVDLLFHWTLSRLIWAVWTWIDIETIRIFQSFSFNAFQSWVLSLLWNFTLNCYCLIIKFIELIENGSCRKTINFWILKIFRNFWNNLQPKFFLLKLKNYLLRF